MDSLIGAIVIIDLQRVQRVRQARIAASWIVRNDPRILDFLGQFPEFHMHHMRSTLADRMVYSAMNKAAS